MPDAFVKGMHITTGGGFSFLPSILLKFQIKAHLEHILEFDEHVSSTGVNALSSLSRPDLLDLCMDRCIGDPTWSHDQLQQGARGWYERLSQLKTVAKPAQDFAVCPYRARLALLALNSVSSVRTIAATGDLTRKLYMGPQTTRLGY